MKSKFYVRAEYVPTTVYGVRQTVITHLAENTTMELALAFASSLANATNPVFARRHKLESVTVVVEYEK